MTDSQNNLDPNQETPTTDGSTDKDNQDNQQERQGISPEDMQHLKDENQKLASEIETLKQNLPPEPKPPQTQEPDPVEQMSPEQEADLLYSDTQKWITLQRAKIKNEIKKDFGFDPNEYAQMKQKMDMQERIQQQQMRAAESMKKRGFDPENEFKTYGNDIMQKLREDPSLSQSKNGVHLAWLAVKEEKGEFEPVNIEQTSTVRGGSVAGDELPEGLTAEEEKAYKLFLKDEGVSKEDAKKLFREGAEDYKRRVR